MHRLCNGVWLRARHFSTSPRTGAQIKKALNLDPSLRALLKDVDISLSNHITATAPIRKVLTEISPSDIVEDNIEASFDSTETYEEEEDVWEVSSRKSPAAAFGSNQIGAVILPVELQNSINAMISGVDKVRLHSDAERLFQETKADGTTEWSTQYGSEYRSRIQARRHDERDGTAFATVALPAHYSAIFAVLDHLKNRMDPTWRVTRVLDWGSATGSGFWAAVHVFQPLKVDQPAVEDLRMENSTIRSYLSIDKRDGLTAIAKRLLRGYNTDNKIELIWKRGFSEDEHVAPEQRSSSLALSAFLLSSMPNPSARKHAVTQMWESGADTMVIIDHGTAAGFEAVVAAREHLLKLGQRLLEEETESLQDEKPRGCHVVAPCPHDQQCPLQYRKNPRDFCGFSQRLQRPSFVRLTKHSGQGHEDIGYSYVVIQRGPRPGVVTADPVGRVGSIGQSVLDKAETHKELSLHTQNDKEVAVALDQSVGIEESIATTPDGPQLDLPSQLRLEAYRWPRLVFRPIKRSGHILLDGCTEEGNIMRMTVPKSQGKQPFYDARKSSWGDLFPHKPKTSHVRFVGMSTPESKPNRGKGDKRAKKKDRHTPGLKSHHSYEVLEREAKAGREDSKRTKRRAAKEQHSEDSDGDQ